MGPEDVELGEEIIKVRRRRRSGVVVSVRLSPDHADQLHELAAQTGKTISQLAREALQSLLRTGTSGLASVPYVTATASGGLLEFSQPASAPSQTMGNARNARPDEVVVDTS